MNDAPEMENCLLIGGPFAGFKTRVPAGMKVLNIDDRREASVLTASSIQAIRKGLDDDKEYQGTFYLLERCDVALGGDTVSVLFGVPAGTTLGQAFSDIIAGYCLMCRPEDYIEEDEEAEDLVH